MSSPQPQRSSSIVPLARDAEGNVIQLPEGAVGWRIRRQTGGRPRLHLDSRKQPMTFPLDYTVADVEDILPPGSYLLDAVDKSGETLGLTIALSIGQPRNGEPVEPGDEAAPIAVPAALPATTSDVRLVLEANVRATQLAFLHNQKTLELGLRMAETLRDTVQVLASSQADWIRSISSARGFFRNAPPLPPVETKQLAASAGEDLEANDDELAAASEAPPRHWTEQFAPLINMAAQQLVPAIGAWAARQRARPEKSDDDRPPFEARELFDLNYAYQKTQAHRARKAAEKQASSEPSAASATASTVTRSSATHARR